MDSEIAVVIALFCRTHGKAESPEGKLDRGAEACTHRVQVRLSDYLSGIWLRRRSSGLASAAFFHHLIMSCFSAFKTFLPSRARKPSTMADLPQAATHAHDPNSGFATHPDCYCVGTGEDEAFSTIGEWEKEVTGKPPSYTEPLFRPEVAKTIEEELESLSDELRELSLKIHGHPEIMWQEKYAHDTLTAFMQDHGFDVTPHYLGLETAWRATFEVGKGGRTVGFQSEMDALPGIGHACGHNLIAIIGVGCAIAVARAIKKYDIAAKVVLLGTPAEEGGQGKVKLIDAGGYKEMDACLMAHPTAGPPRSARTGSSLAIQVLTIQYFGRTAHAAGAPWEGKNALDAAFLAYSAISVLRQQIKPTHRVHGIVEGRDWAPNVIPDYAKCQWLIRAPTWAEVQVLHDRIKKCFEAAALATECRMEWSEGVGTYDVRQNECLADEFTRMSEKFGIDATRGTEAAMSASTDFGNVSYELPSLHPTFAIPTELGGANHTALFTKAAATKEAHVAALQITKALAITGARILIDDDFMAEVKKAYDDGRTTGTVG
ncbi:hypothetical protein M407DRAFT_17012 [Tulasnella calospora MUT 4182]|uniref:Peptidase M20 dimerisation domain-containing protein n=1 Tax=Tulasnella calospora MUT 4182 TaxID=1051891 RepID=A0A0C3QY40_9AGAM|nr:hypothetical protein M407DRAFT_17012 [Tulasnella calospora MUT 4182]